MVMFEINQGRAKPHRVSNWVLHKATDQIGSGLRSQRSVYTDFDKDDPEVVEQPTTRFTRSDAAHFCNLGLKPGLESACQGSDFLRDGCERLKVYAGNTMLMPQAVNIGPDRVIDDLHGTLALEMLDDGQTIFTRQRVAACVSRASEAMSDHRDGRIELGELGLAACTAVYLKAYAGDAVRRRTRASRRGRNPRSWWKPLIKSNAAYRDVTPCTGKTRVNAGHSVASKRRVRTSP
jgi:hypothetical protein